MYTYACNMLHACLLLNDIQSRIVCVCGGGGGGGGAGGGGGKEGGGGGKRRRRKEEEGLFKADAVNGGGQGDRSVRVRVKYRKPNVLYQVVQGVGLGQACRTLSHTRMQAHRPSVYTGTPSVRPRDPVELMPFT